MEDFVRKLPKAELHLHIEGTMEPELVVKLAERNGVPLSLSLEELKERRKNFKDLQSFLDEFYIVSSVLLKEEDFYELGMEYFKKCHEENIRYCEVFFNTCIHAQKGLSFDEVMSGLQRAADEAEEKYGVTCKWILILVKNFSHEANLQMIEDARKHAEKFVGVGLAGAEVGYPCRNLKGLVEAAKNAGLCGPKGEGVVAHAGEEGDPAYVIDALHTLGLARIDHGVRCLESAHMMKFLGESQLPVTSCPLSNRSLKVLDRFCEGKHVVKKFMDAGACVSVNSDDPAFFGGYMVENFMTIINEDFAGLEEKEIKQRVVKLCVDSFRSSFLPQEKKEDFIQMVYDSAELDN